jgi:hypothetical protein
VEIEEILELKQVFSPNWVSSHAERIADYYPPNGKKKAPTEQDLQFDITWVPLANVGSAFSGRVVWSHPKNSKTTNLQLNIPEDNWSFVDPAEMQWLYNRGTYVWLPSPFPQRLGQFADWWNGLSSGTDLLIPDEMSISGTVSGRSTGGRFFFGTDEGAKLHPVQLRLGCVKDESCSYSGYMQGHELDIPIVKLVRYHLTQEMFHRQFHNLSARDFRFAFYDLDQSTKEKRDLKLEDIKEFIHDDAVKGAEVFEAFGMKFPAGQVTLWGIVLLLSVQIYFVTYLKQLKGKLGLKDAGWDVPWIGINSNWEAQTLFFITVTPLPFGAIAFLAAREMSTMATRSSDQSTNRKIIHFLLNLNGARMGHPSIFYLLSFACFLGLWLGIMSWNYRPQIVSQLDEDNPESTQPTFS